MLHTLRLLLELLRLLRLGLVDAHRFGGGAERRGVEVAQVLDLAQLGLHRAREGELLLLATFRPCRVVAAALGEFARGARDVERVGRHLVEEDAIVRDDDHDALLPCFVRRELAREPEDRTDR